MENTDRLTELVEKLRKAVITRELNRDRRPHFPRPLAPHPPH